MSFDRAYKSSKKIMVIKNGDEEPDSRWIHSLEWWEPQRLGQLKQQIARAHCNQSKEENLENKSEKMRIKITE